MSKVITGKVRFSFLNWAAPRTNELNGKEEYGCELIIPKEDTATVNAIKAAMKEVITTKWGDKIPPKLKNPLKDGDTELKADGSELPELYKGNYFLRVKTTEKPGVIDAEGQKMTNPDDFKSGDYGRASINAFAYDASANKGVSFFLANLQQLEVGERFGGKVTANDDFGVKPSAISDFA